MKIAYCDCFSGISGDMFLGALMDLGVGIDCLERELAKISLSVYQLKVNKDTKCSLGGT